MAGTAADLAAWTAVGWAAFGKAWPKSAVPGILGGAWLAGKALAAARRNTEARGRIDPGRR